MITAVVFSIGWLRHDHDAHGWGTSHQIQGDDPEEADMAENRYLSEVFLLLLETVPASIVAMWFVVTWIVFGRDAVRLKTIKSHLTRRK